MLLPSFPFVVFDTETTGFVPKVNRIIEFAAMRVENGEIVDSYEQLFEIEEKIPLEIQILTRITQESLNGKPAMDKSRNEILKFIGLNTVLIGQNIPFDIGMMKGEGISLEERPYIDTAMLASLVFPELESYSLGHVSSALNLHHEPKHRALGDVRATLELFGACWQRLLELPDEQLSVLKNIFSKSDSEGYRILASSIPKSTKKKTPPWLNIKHNSDSKNKSSLLPIDLPMPKAGTVEILKEPLCPDTLSRIILAASDNESTIHWIAVKNLEAVVRSVNLPLNVRVLYPPFLLLDTAAKERFLSQQSFTADETLLAVKLNWYDPKTSGEFPLHGPEQSVWSAKLACTNDSEIYKNQFFNLPSVLLLDHKQLLLFLSDPQHSAYGALSEKAHVIIDDASMLEDTATSAYGWYCSLDTLRAGAQGNEELTAFTDVLAIWVERTRNTQDIRYLTFSDLSNSDVRGMRIRASELLTKKDIPSSVKQILSHVVSILGEENLGGRIAFLEQRFNGSLVLQSVPEHLGNFLQQFLYEKYSVSLLMPPAQNSRLTEILPKNTPHSSRIFVDNESLCAPSIILEESLTLKDIFENPPNGKSIVLATSKRIIDDVFVRQAIAMEEKGVTLICQGFNGGINRTRAEFLSAKKPVIWMLTPWAYEGVHLPPKSADFLFLTGLPFDHPSHAILSRRAEHYKDPFNEYSLPRMLSRIFRLLRTFSSHCTENSSVHFLDQRIHSKKYGEDVKAYLKEITSNTQENDDGQMSLI